MNTQEYLQKYIGQLVLQVAELSAVVDQLHGEVGRLKQENERLSVIPPSPTPS